MPKTIVVDMGDCLINISRQEGFFWQSIWNHPQNAQLQALRKKYNIIKKGDQIFIPDKTQKQVPKPTDQRHIFVRKGLTFQFTLTILNGGEPRANEPFILIVNGLSRKGTTDGDGKLTKSIPAEAREGLLLLGEKQEEITLNFGFVDPIEEISGVKSRLRNLGFYDGEVDDEVTPETTTALAEFQRSVGLSGEGELTGATRQALVEVHGS